MRKLALVLVALAALAHTTGCLCCTCGSGEVPTTTVSAARPEVSLALTRTSAVRPSALRN